MNQELTGFGRFAEPSLYILVSLSDGPKHGYAIMSDVEGFSGQPLGPGTLYAALARLEQRGLIEALAAGRSSAGPTGSRRSARRRSRRSSTGSAGFARIGLERLKGGAS